MRHTFWAPMVLLLAVTLMLQSCRRKVKITEDNVQALFTQLNDICDNPTDSAFDEIFDPDLADMGISQAPTLAPAATSEQPKTAAAPQPAAVETAAPAESEEDQEQPQAPKVNEFREQLKHAFFFDQCDAKDEKTEQTKAGFSYDTEQIIIAETDTTYVNMRFEKETGTCRMTIPKGEARVTVKHQVGAETNNEYVFFLKSGRNGLRIYGIRDECND